MKTLILSLVILFTAQVFAQESKPYIQCSATPEEYANNRFAAIVLPKLPIKVTRSSSVMLIGEIEEVSFPVHQNYEVRISGYVMKPGNVWIEGGTELLLTAELLQVMDPAAPKKVLDKDVAGSRTVSNPKQLEAAKQGAVRTFNELNNSDYLSAAERKEEIAKTQLTSMKVSCELVR